jgi:hypothetical protein
VDTNKKVKDKENQKKFCNKAKKTTMTKHKHRMFEKRRKRKRYEKEETREQRDLEDF